MAPSTLLGSHLYEHLGVQATQIDSSSGECRMILEPDLLGPGGLRAAPLGLLFERGAATYAFNSALAVPVQLSVHVRNRCRDVRAIRATSRLISMGRTLMVIDGNVVDDDKPNELVAYISSTWSVIGDAPPMKQQQTGDDRATGPRPPLLEAVGICGDPESGECRLEEIDTKIAGPGGVLHAGVLQLLSEEAALLAGARALAKSTIRATECTYHFVRAAKAGPFRATPRIIAEDAESADVEVVVVDEGVEDRLCCLAHVQIGCA